MRKTSQLLFLFQIFEAIVTPEFCLHYKVHNFGNISFSTSHKAHKSIMVFRPELVTKTVHHKGRLPAMYSMFQNTLDEFLFHYIFSPLYFQLFISIFDHFFSVLIHLHRSLFIAILLSLCLHVIIIKPLILLRH